METLVIAAIALLATRSSGTTATVKKQAPKVTPDEAEQYFVSGGKEIGGGIGAAVGGLVGASAVGKEVGESVGAAAGKVQTAVVEQGPSTIASILNWFQKHF